MKEQSQRQLRVAQQIRGEIVRLMQRGEFDHPDLENPAAITVTEVSMSPDLKNARAYVAELGTEKIAKETLKALNEMAPHVQGQIARNLGMRATPRLRFDFDESFGNAARMNALLSIIKTSDE